QRCDRHEDHQQDEQDVDERSYVDICFGFDLLLYLFHFSRLLPADLIVQPLGQQTNLVDACVANIVDDLDDIAILGTAITFDENSPIELACQEVIDLRSEVVDVHFVLTKIEFSVAGDGNKDCIVSIGFFHVDGIFCLGELDADALLQHWSDNHENDQKDEHHVRHRRYVDVGGNFSSTAG